MARSNRKIKPAVAWAAISGAVVILTVPAVISLGQPTATIDEKAVSERFLCDRSCLSEGDLCIRQAGIYRPSVERCEIKLETCRQACQPPILPEPQPMTLRRCADWRCKPQRDNCFESAKDADGLQNCENAMIDCLSQCRLETKTAAIPPTDDK